MITIFLCDDDIKALEHYAHIINKTATQNSIDITISSFCSGEELLFHLVDSPSKADIIYLDILMGQENGMDTAKKLRKHGCKSEIIFLTSSEDYVYDAFDIAPIQYLLKSETPTDKFERTFLRAVSLAQEKTSNMFTCETGSIQKLIPIKDIGFFEIWKRVVTVHFGKNETVNFYATMEQLEDQLLDKGFARVHRSYIVNLPYILHFQQNSLKLKTGEDIPIGVTYVKHIRKVFTDYISDTHMHGY